MLSTRSFGNEDRRVSRLFHPIARAVHGCRCRLVGTRNPPPEDVAFSTENVGRPKEIGSHDEVFHCARFCSDCRIERPR